MSEQDDRSEQLRELRESARRARRLAMGFSNADGIKLLRYAEEQERQASALEKQIGVGAMPPPSGPPVLQVQVQQQQQHETGPPAEPEKPQSDG